MIKQINKTIQILVLSAVHGADRGAPVLNGASVAARNVSHPRPHARPRTTQKKKTQTSRCAVLTFNLVFGQVHRRAVGEDVRDGADPPVHQRGGDRVHRHDCDLWLAASRALVVHERLQQTAEGAQQLPPTVAERGAGELVHGWGAGRGGAAGDGGFLRSVFANLFRFRTGEKGEVGGWGWGCVRASAEWGRGASYLMVVCF